MGLLELLLLLLAEELYVLENLLAPEQQHLLAHDEQQLLHLCHDLWRHDHWW
jgi:hypothetical protein